ncbi:MAG: pilus assembly protein TadG-related protein [Thermodesulfobacteriota bacterium]
MKRFRFFSAPPGERGSITPIVALGLVAFAGFMALSIDLGQLYLVKNEVQNVADAAALAAAKKLIQDKNGDGVAEVYCAEAIQAAIDYAKENSSFGVTSPIAITETDVTIGKWNLATKQFDATGCTDGTTTAIQVNAVQVTVNRAGGEGGNDKVSTFFGSVMGVGTRDTDPDTLIETGPPKLSVAASSVAMLGLAGTSALDLPFAVSTNWPAGGTPTASNGIHRLLEKFAPSPAYASDPQTYTWKDLGGSNLDTTRATFVMPLYSERTSLTKLQQYIKGPTVSGGLQYPQVTVGQKVYPISEYLWGSNIKNNFNYMKTRFTAVDKTKTNGKWRVTAAVYNTTPVTSALPQDSWYKLASRLLPGVSQAHACMSYTVPAVYVQGFIELDVTNVVCPSTCTTGDQSYSTSCRNQCYATVEVPLNQNTVSTDKGSNPIPYQKDYKDMNSTANKVGVFASVPRLVK